MKLFKHFLLMSAVAGSMMFASCSKETPANNTNTGGTVGRIVCKVNGTSWTSDAPDKFYYPAGDTIPGTIATLVNGELMIQGNRIVGTDSSAVVMNLVLTPAKTGKYEGTFSASAADGALYLPNRDIMSLLTIVMGYTNTYSVTLTKVDTSNKLVSGVFTITMKAPAGQGLPDYTITEGSFTDVKIN